MRRAGGASLTGPGMGSAASIRVDAAIVGAGISGLWLANLLLGRGLSVVVCDPNPVGGAQTMASQGIIHSGLKYALGGSPTRASKLLSPMPGRWRACLAGKGELDLRGVPVLAEHVHLFGADAGAAVTALFARYLMAGQSRRVDASAVAPFHRGALLELDDFAIDVPALMERLAAPLRERLIPVAATPEPPTGGAPGIGGLRAGGQRIHAGVYLFAAGTGNQALAQRAGFADVAMRRLPLQQTMVRLRKPPRLFAHCLAGALAAAVRPAMEPELTITSHGHALYVGGKVASTGADRPADQQIAAVRDLLGRHLPAIDLAGASFETVTAIRAEPARRRQDGAIPGDAYAARHGNCVLCWPVKLSLAPRLGDLVAALLDDLQPGPDSWSGNLGATPQRASAPYAPAAGQPC